MISRDAGDGIMQAIVRRCEDAAGSRRYDRAPGYGFSFGTTISGIDDLLLQSRRHMARRAFRFCISKQERRSCSDHRDAISPGELGSHRRSAEVASAAAHASSGGHSMSAPRIDSAGPSSFHRAASDRLPGLADPGPCVKAPQSGMRFGARCDQHLGIGVGGVEL